MKRCKSLIAATSLITALISPNLLAAELVVVVDNIKDIQGNLYVSLYDNEKDFETNQNAVKRQKVAVDKQRSRLLFQIYLPGTMA